MAPLELEVPVFSPASAQVALARASRIELNRAGSYPKGGLTPELSDVQSLSAVPIPLRISKQVLIAVFTLRLEACAVRFLYLRAACLATVPVTGRWLMVACSFPHLCRSSLSVLC